MGSGGCCLRLPTPESNDGVFRAPRFRSSLYALFVAVGAGCASSGEQAPPKSPEQQPVCRDSPGDDVKMAANTGVAGAKTGVKTAVEGVKTAGRATVGFVEGGSGEASRQWNSGKRDTKQTARESSAEVRREGSVPECPPGPPP